MSGPFSRSELLLGKQGMDRLESSKIAVFGLGGVGSFAVEALARTGIGSIVLIDYDIIDITNINRQIQANTKTVGLSKVEVMRDRIIDINPNIEVVVYNKKYDVNSRESLLSVDYDYVIDAIDIVSSKIDLIVQCKERGIPIISSMGAGNKLNPAMFKVGDIYSTKVCALAKVIRRELRRRDIKALKVVYSEEEPRSTNFNKDNIKIIPSIAFVPSVVGLIIASEVIKDIALTEV